MKKLVLLASAFALILGSCTPDLPQMEENTLQEVVFTSSTELKNDIFDCDNANPDYAILTITHATVATQVITVPVFYIGEVMYTQAIKLPPGDYTLTDMRLFATGENPDGTADNNDGGNAITDLLVNAVPYDGSDYGALITAPVPADITVSAFAKTEVPISILCYTPDT
mgnify:FL=1